MSHWYQNPLDVCRECGKPHDDPSHLRVCDAIRTIQGVGYAFCRLAAGHNGPHQLRNWDGAEYFGHADGTIEPMVDKP